MWYKHFSKQSWNLRVWRKQNLFYNQDDLGMFRMKHIRNWKDFIFRMTRNEGILRGFNFFFGYALIGALIYVKKIYYDPVYVVPKEEIKKKQLEELDAHARSKLFYNRFDAPSRPHRSLDDLIAFLGGSQTYDDLADYLSYDGAMDISMDQQKGLDSWMSWQDQRSLKYYQRNLGKNVKIE